MCERVTIIETLEKMNSNLERIATALERAYPPEIITDKKENTEDRRSQLDPDMYYNVIKCRWEKRAPCPNCKHPTMVFMDDRKTKVWYRCEECGKEDEIYLKDLGLFWGVL